MSSAQYSPTHNNLQIDLPPIAGGGDGDRMWKWLCLTTDREAAVYFSTLFVMVLVLGFCFYQLIHNKACTDQQAYLSVLSMVLGVIVPSPVVRTHRNRPYNAV
jgi:hypothetical protein